MPVEQAHVGDIGLNQELIDTDLLDDDGLLEEPVTSGGDIDLWNNGLPNKGSSCQARQKKDDKEEGVDCNPPPKGD